MALRELSGLPVLGLMLSLHQSAAYWGWPQAEELPLGELPLSGTIININVTQHNVLSSSTEKLCVLHREASEMALVLELVATGNASLMSRFLF